MHANLYFITIGMECNSIQTTLVAVNQEFIILVISYKYL